MFFFLASLIEGPFPLVSYVIKPIKRTPNLQERYGFFLVSSTLKQLYYSISNRTIKSGPLHQCSPIFPTQNYMLVNLTV